MIMLSRQKIAIISKEIGFGFGEVSGAGAAPLWPLGATTQKYQIIFLHIKCCKTLKNFDLCSFKWGKTSKIFKFL